MDWERTKTVLILAFLLLNLFFVYQLWVAPTFFDPSLSISQHQIDAKLAELKYQNISVSAEVPKKLKLLQMLVVHSPELSAQNIAEKLLGQGFLQTAGPAPGDWTFATDVASVTVQADGKIVYSSDRHGISDLSLDAARAKADDFLRQSDAG